MKIGLALERFDPQRGGLETWTSQFAEKLVEAGHEVHVIACGFANPEDRGPLTFHPVEDSSSPLRRAAALEQTLRGLSLDVIHDMGCGWYADIFHPHGGSSVAFRDYNLMRIPRWRQFRLWREKRYREQEQIEKRQHANEQSVIVAVSRMVQGHLETIHYLPPERIRLIPNGVDTKKFSHSHGRDHREAVRRELSCAEHETLFLLVAHNLRLKNVEAAIRGLARLVKDGASARLAVVGGRRPQPFVRLARKLGLDGRVDFLNPVVDVRPYFAAADAYIHPTWYDPCSLVVLEALACGLPVITTRFNGVSELMTEGEQGFIMENPADIPALSGKMKLLLDEALRSKMAKAAEQLAQCLSFDQQTKHFLALYAEVEGKRS